MMHRFHDILSVEYMTSCDLKETFSCDTIVKTMVHVCFPISMQTYLKLICSSYPRNLQHFKCVIMELG